MYISQMKGATIDYAAAFNHAELIEFLLACGDNVDHQDQEGSTPLMVAIVYNAREAVAMLLRHGSDNKIVDHKGLNILHCIALFATAEMMQFFAGLAETGGLAGISITQETQEGLTPLQAFNRRSAASPQLGGHFERLLDALSRSADNAIVRVDEHVVSESIITREEEEEEFYDALEIP